MNIDHLKYFISVVDNKSFSIAAEECYISQSSLSKYIKALEKELDNVQLLDRSGKKVIVTEAGKSFYKYAQNVLEDYRAMRKDMRKYGQGIREVLQIGTIPVINDYELTDVFHSFQSVYPRIQLNLIEDNSTPIIELYDKKIIDIAFLRDNYLPKDSSTYNKYLLAEDKLVLIVNRDHPLADKDIIDLKEAKDEMFLFLSKKTGMYQSCHIQCERSGFEPKETVLDVRSSTIRNLVARNQGVSLMMYQSVKNIEDNRIRLIQLIDPITIGLVLIIRKNLNSDAVSTFLEYVCDSYGRLDSLVLQ